MLHYLFTHPSKWTVNSKKTWVEYVTHFYRLTCGPIGRSPRKALSTWSTNDSDIHSHWIYIQRPPCIFNLSSSSSSAAGNARSHLRWLAALLSTPRCKPLPHRRPGHPSNPSHLLLFSANCSPTPHQNQLTLVVLSIGDISQHVDPEGG